MNESMVRWLDEWMDIYGYINIMDI